MKPSAAAGGLLGALADALSAAEALPELLSDGTTKPMLADMLRSNPAAVDIVVKGGLSQAADRLRADEEAELRRWETEFALQGRPADAERCRLQRETLRQHEAVLALFVDQFEEIFMLADQASQTERNAFLVALDALARSGRVFTTASVRSDFFARTSELPIVAALIREGALYQLEPPIPSELAQIIREPAREAGLSFEEDRESGERLDDVLLTATRGDPAALPLLEFALDRLYEERDADGRLTFRAYRAMNQVEGALAQTAEAQFSALSVAAAASFERLFSALVNLNEVRSEERPVRRRASLVELRVHPGVAEFIDRFVAARLLVLDQDAAGAGSVAVVHEALFSHWNRLAAWIEDNRDRLRVRGRVEPAAARWEAEGRPRDLLLPDGRLLAEADDLVRHADALALSSSVRAFVGESVMARRRRLYRRVAAVVVLTTGIAVAGIVSWYQYQSYTRNRIETKLFEYRQAVREAENKFLGHGPSSAGIKEAYDKTRDLLRVIGEFTAMQGSPPEGWEDATAKAHEFGAVLLAELGDVDGSLREIEARRAMAPTCKPIAQEPKCKAIGLDEVLGRNPAMMSYALTVFDLQMELAIANQALLEKLRHDPKLREALQLPPETEKPADAAVPQAAEPDPEKVERFEFARNKGFVNLLEYMT